MHYIIIRLSAKVLSSNSFSSQGPYILLTLAWVEFQRKMSFFILSDSAYTMVMANRPRKEYIYKFLNQVYSRWFNLTLSI